MLEKYNLNHYRKESSGDDFSDWLYENTSVDAPHTDVDAAWEKISSEISKGKSRKISLAPVLKVAAVMALLIATVVIFRTYTAAPDLIEVVSREGTKNIILPDGSSVILRKGSELHFSETFEKDRIVKFTGEAYFEIAKRESPFLIEMNGGTVEILGTAFNLTSNKTEIEVAVDHGLVELSSSKGSVKVPMGNFAKLDKLTQQLSLVDSTPSNIHSWRTGEFKFTNTPLRQVIVELEKHYDATFKVSKKVANCRVTANFDNLSIDEVCDALQTILAVNITNKNNTVSVRGKGCE